ncbi:MAG TPA: pyridoxamine 5'-phosphate oxidase family protein [Actinomycetota bacterium]|nr:pyridoxamine 5'-phosphate oxidase family protein [Actinomycetota bacterium]
MLPSDLDFLEALQTDSFEKASAATASSYPPERRMGAGAVAAYLDLRRYLIVSTVRPSGSPHAALSAFVFAGECFWLPTMEGTARARNLASTPYASIVVADGDGADHKAVLAEGRTELVARPEPAAVDAWNARDGRLPEWASRWIELRPEKLFSYDAGLPEPIQNETPETLVGRRCDECGDTFTVHPGDAARCPSCGSDATGVASEPFL